LGDCSDAWKYLFDKQPQVLAVRSTRRRQHIPVARTTHYAMHMGGARELLQWRFQYLIRQCDSLGNVKRLLKTHCSGTTTLCDILVKSAVYKNN